MSVTEVTEHEHRSYGAENGCTACLAEVAALRDLDRAVLAEVERVDYVRSAEQIADIMRNGPITAGSADVGASLRWLADNSMIEARDVRPILPPKPTYVGYVRLDSMFGHQMPSRLWGEIECVQSLVSFDMERVWHPRRCIAGHNARPWRDGYGALRCNAGGFCGREITAVPEALLT